MKRLEYIIGAAAVCVIAFVVYFATRTPEGVAPMNGGSSAIIASISLATAIVSLVGTIVGLVQKLVELRVGKGE
jgi:hypothetical protein